MIFESAGRSLEKGIFFLLLLSEFRLRLSPEADNVFPLFDL